MTNFESSWNEYWQSGLVTSCVSQGVDGYPQARKKIWNNFFLILKEGHNIVDLCSGGGGIPQLIMDYCTDKDTQLNITLTDLAVIQNKLIEQEGINLSYLSNCNCETLPFDEQTIDIVTSSFGIEYSDLTKTIAEISRTVKKGGYFSGVLHTYDSEIVKNSNSQMQQASELLNDSSFFDVFKKTTS